MPEQTTIHSQANELVDQVDFSSQAEVDLALEYTYVLIDRLANHHGLESQDTDCLLNRLQEFKIDITKCLEHAGGLPAVEPEAEPMFHDGFGNV